MSDWELRVAVADDDPALRALLREVIDAEPGLELVGMAEDAAGAAQVAREHDPDVVVLDWMMPGGGPAAAQEILADRADARIVAFTAASTHEAAREMLSAGAKRVLLKGAPISVIVEAIKEAAQP